MYICVYAYLYICIGRRLRLQRLLHVDAVEVHRAGPLHPLLRGRVGRQGPLVARLPRQSGLQGCGV